MVHDVIDMMTFTRIRQIVMYYVLVVGKKGITGIIRI
jgi:hypothetical protein